jgi:HK97 gp10 family phage protein
MQVEIKGLSNLLKKLDKLGGNLPAAMRKAKLAGGLVIEGAVKENCPVESGRLRESHTTQAIDDHTVSVSTNVDYAIPVEYGTGPKGDPAVPHTAKKYWRYKGPDGRWITSHGQAPQPYMRLAFKQSKDKALEVIQKSLQDSVRELMK